MRNFRANAIVITGIAGVTGVISVPVIRISGHNERAGIGA